MARAHGLLGLATELWKCQPCEFHAAFPQPNCTAPAGGWEALAAWGEPEVSGFLNQKTQTPQTMSVVLPNSHALLQEPTRSRYLCGLPTSYRSFPCALGLSVSVPGTGSPQPEFCLASPAFPVGHSLTVPL